MLFPQLAQRSNEFIDINDQKFGKRTVIKRVENKSNKVRYLVRCDCNREDIAYSYDLRNGRSNSCPNCRIKTHGKSNTSTFRIWLGMLRRCYNPNFKHYSYYGGRGIKVCDRWRSSFQNFYADMVEKPENLQLDRINNNGDYESANCRWATRSQQQSNKRNSNKGAH